MTLFGTVSTALARVDRTVTALRAGYYASAGGVNQILMMPAPANQPIRLSGADRLITYADTVASYPTIFAVWSKLVRNLATTDVGVFENPGQGRPLRRVYDTDLEQLLREPAPGKGLVDLLQWLFNPYFVEGNGLIAKYRETPGELPANLLPLDWRAMSANARPGGPVEEWVSYQMGAPRALAPSEVVHLAWHAPTGNAIGVSPLRALEVGVKLDDAAARQQVASFDNGSRPGGALVLPDDADLSDEEKAAMRAQVEARYQGVDNAFRVALLSGGVKWEPMGFSAVEAELLGTRARSQEEVCIAYDVKRSVIAEPQGGGQGDTKEILRDFQRSLRPHAVLAQNVLQRQLIDPEPEWSAQRLCVRFDLSDLVRGTYMEELEAASHGFTNGVLALNEARARVGETPIEDDAASRPLIPHAQLDPNSSTADNRRLSSTETEPDRSVRPAAPAVTQ